MPFATNEGARIHWMLQGRESAPAAVVLHGIGADNTLFERIAPLLSEDVRLLRIDLRGHGASDATAGDYTLDLLARDVLAVMDMAGIGRATVCGVSLGGMVAMALALSAPERVSALLLACTSAEMAGPFWADRVAAVRKSGLGPIAEAATSRVLSEEFARRHPGVVDSARTALRGMDPAGYAGCGAAIRDMKLVSRLGAIRVTTVLMTGSEDGATPFEGHGERIVAGIAGARHVTLPTGHWACVEAPDAFANVLRDLAREE